MNTLAPSFLIGSSTYSQVTRTSIISRTSSKFGQIGPRIAELAALERPEKSSFLIGSSLFLQETRTWVTAGMSSSLVFAQYLNKNDQLRPNFVYTLSLTRSTLLL